MSWNSAYATCTVHREAVCTPHAERSCKRGEWDIYTAIKLKSWNNPCCRRLLKLIITSTSLNFNTRRRHDRADNWRYKEQGSTLSERERLGREDKATVDDIIIHKLHNAATRTTPPIAQCKGIIFIKRYSTASNSKVWALTLCHEWLQLTQDIGTLTECFEWLPIAQDIASI